MLIESKITSVFPDVSVIVMTYNHVLFLEECIEHILSQEFDLSYEIIIADDYSTDGTREICKKYQEQYPDKVRLLLQDSNQGFMRNYADSLKLCRGKYIAICSGDDYWCDNSKLQQQYDCLEEKDGYGFVRTEGYELRNGQLVETSGGHMDKEGDVRDVAIYGPLGFASSAFFKRELLQFFDMEEIIRRGITMEDYPMHAIFSHHTKFALIRERMVVYRILDTSVSHQKAFVKSMRHAVGYQEARRYIMELYPNEVPWTRTDIQDAQNYAYLKIYYYMFDRKQAQTLLFQTKQYKTRPLVRYRNFSILFYLISILLHLKSK